MSPNAITWRCVCGFDRGRPATVGSVLLNRLLRSCHATKIGITSNTNIRACTYLLQAFRGFRCPIVSSPSGDASGLLSGISLSLLLNSLSSYLSISYHYISGHVNCLSVINQTRAGRHTWHHRRHRSAVGADLSRPSPIYRPSAFLMLVCLHLFYTPNISEKPGNGPVNSLK